MPITSTVTVAPNVWIRKHERTQRFAASALVWSVLMLLLLVPLLLAEHSRWHTNDDIAVGLTFGALAAPGLWMARRLGRAGLWMGPDGIVVRNPFSTYRLALSDVDSFAPGVLSGGTNGTPCPLVKQTHGADVGIWALGREGVYWRFAAYQQEMEPLCDELNVQLRNLRAGTTAAPPQSAR